MPFLVSEIVKETVTAVATTAAIAAPSNQVCFDDTTKIFGISIGQEVVRCFDQPMPEIVIHESNPFNPAPSIGLHGSVTINVR